MKVKVIREQTLTDYHAALRVFLDETKGIKIRSSTSMFEPYATSGYNGLYIITIFYTQELSAKDLK
jgi:hypothetical protein